jgi:gliding motility-associatede transport system auxiliary component
MTRSGDRILSLVVGTTGLIACGVLVLILAYRHNLRLDLSPQRSYTLSTHAKKILVELPRDVHLMVFVRSEDPRTPELKDLLWRFTQETRRITYEFVDLNRSPTLARQYGIDRYGAIVVESGTRRRDVSNPNEALVMGALLAVTRDRERTVYFLTGHGERSPDDGDRKSGMSVAKNALEDDQFIVRTLPLMQTESVPIDATVVVMAGPRKDYLPGELTQLEGYLHRGGNVLLLLDPETPASITAFVGGLGITSPEQVVVDPERRLAGGEGVTVMVSDLLSSFLVSGTLEAPPVFSYARPLRILEPMSSSAISFLKTSGASYAVAPEDIRADAKGQPTGALVVGAALVPIADHNGRVIVLGDSDFASNGVIDYLGNKDLLLNSINWLARDESLLSARAQSKEVGREQFFVTETQGAWSFWLATVLQPALFFAAGAVVFLRRRRA